MPTLAGKEKCTGCMACLNACPTGAIRFDNDEEGFLMPVVDEKMCVDCHLCEQSCPESQEQFHQSQTESEVYAGWNTLYRSVSSSGGAFTTIARYVLSNKGYVYGAYLDENFNCHHIEVNNIDDLGKIRGSKYIQSSIGKLFQDAKKRLIAGNYVLFTGTPCQISGLKSFLKKEYPKLITIDLICHGVPSQAVFSSYIDKLNRKLTITEDDKVLNYEFRQCNRWAKFPSIVSVKNNHRLLFGINALYMFAFDKAAIFRRSCYSCHYTTINRVGDFSIGDFWGIGKYGKSFNYDKSKGVSLLIVNSEKGKSIMDKLSENDFYVKRSIEEAIAGNHNLTKVSAMHCHREAVIKAFLNKELTLDEIDKQFHLVDRSLKQRIIDVSMKIGLYDLLKKIQYIFN